MCFNMLFCFVDCFLNLDARKQDFIFLIEFKNRENESHGLCLSLIKIGYWYNCLQNKQELI